MRHGVGEYLFKLSQEPNLVTKREAFPYQQEAVEFVSSRDASAIFHEQGLGKTKIAFDVMLLWLSKREVDTILIITKKGLIGNWQREFGIHTHIRPAVLSENSRQNYYVFTSPTRIVLAHYEVVKKEEKRLTAWLKTRRVAGILDEAVKIKNPNADLTRAFFRVAPLFTKRIIMTGTPAANRPFDVWAPVFFLDSGKTFGTDFHTFKRQTDLSKDFQHNPVLFAQYQRKLAEVSEKLARISIRETKSSGRIILPTKEFVRVDCTWEPMQFEMYRQVREDLRAVIFRDGKLIEEDEEIILKRLLRLIQITSNPKLVDETYNLEPGKFPVLYELIGDITRKNEKAVVFTSFNPNSVWLAKRLNPFGALCLNGSMPMARRNDVVNWFLQNAEDRILVATTGAAKEGLTLAVANHVIFYDRTYSLDDYLQAQDRIHRVSQKNTCYVYTLVMRDSVDQWIEALIEQKHLAAQLTQGDIDQETYGSRADFNFVDLLRGILSS
jgi:SNF2 family DNA or RNA helicase